MNRATDEFSRFEHAGWERVAERVRFLMDSRGYNANEIYKETRVDAKTQAKILAGK